MFNYISTYEHKDPNSRQTREGLKILLCGESIKFIMIIKNCAYMNIFKMVVISLTNRNCKLKQYSRSSLI